MRVRATVGGSPLLRRELRRYLAAHGHFEDVIFLGEPDPTSSPVKAKGVAELRSRGSYRYRVLS